MCTHKERQHFHAQTTSLKIYMYMGVEKGDLYIDEAHTAMDIFHFVVFFKARCSNWKI